ncbi:MAG TPA: tRNA-dihydrouridine synthase family protein, partial [Victivallales bacterium]|nr:tRNA-dihydrouridine synthase family protein [Victivallales bacterium]
MPESIYPENAIILAPLSGYTDLPYRQSMRRHGCFYSFTEMIDAGSLVFGNGKTLRFLDRAENESWLGCQIIGSDPEILAKATKIISQYKFNIVDFNLGCPVPKVIKKGEGAALAKEIDKALIAFEIIVKNCERPVSAKIRILHEEDPEPSIKLAKGLESVGASAITVHGRVQKQFYSGPVHLKIIKEIKNNLKVQVIANGGINSYSKYNETINYLGQIPIMLATGAMGNPWLFEEISEGEMFIPPRPDD